MKILRNLFECVDDSALDISTSFFPDPESPDLIPFVNPHQYNLESKNYKAAVSNHCEAVKRHESAIANLASPYECKKCMTGMQDWCAATTFDLVDLDGSNSLSCDELQSALVAASGKCVKTKNVVKMMKKFDVNASGELDRVEFYLFVDWLEKKRRRKKLWKQQKKRNEIENENEFVEKTRKELVLRRAVEVEKVERKEVVARSKKEAEECSLNMTRSRIELEDAIKRFRDADNAEVRHDKHKHTYCRF